MFIGQVEVYSCSVVVSVQLHLDVAVAQSYNATLTTVETFELNKETRPAVDECRSLHEWHDQI